MELLGEFFDRRKQVLVLQPSPLLALPCEIGVEVEFEGVRSTEGLDVTRWTTKEDHSLHDRGLEFVFNGPMFGKDVVLALENLYSIAHKHKYKVSRRTGIHVHFDCRDMSRQQLIGQLAYYCMFEPALYNWVGSQRDANNFCLPYYKALGSLDQALHILKCLYLEAAGSVSKAAIRAAASSYHRYSGLNLKSLIDLGSIEFRQLETTLDLQKVFDWINILMLIKQAALQVPESTSRGILDDVVRRGPLATADLVFNERWLSPESKKELFYPEFEFDFYTFGYPNAANLLAFADKVRRITKSNPEGDWELPVTNEGKSHKSAMRLYGALFPKGDQPNQKEAENPDDPLGPPFQVEPGVYDINLDKIVYNIREGLVPYQVYEYVPNVRPYHLANCQVYDLWDDMQVIWGDARDPLIRGSWVGLDKGRRAYVSWSARLGRYRIFRRLGEL